MVEPIDSLSPEALARFRAGLPVLLQALRGRRRRRAAARGGLVAFGIAAIAAVVLARGTPWPKGGGSADPAAPFCVVVRDDPAIVSRCTVPNGERAEWFVDDDTLRALLQAADRPDGLVRVADRVFVAAAAVDPFPSTSP